MGIPFSAENIPNLVRAGASMTLAATNNGQPTRFNVGGQQYALTSLLTLNTASSGAGGLDSGSLGASQVWNVFAIVNQTTFAPALVASLGTQTNGPTTMPSGYGTAFKWLGQFTTTSTSALDAVQGAGNRVDDSFFYKILSADVTLASSNSSVELTDLTVTGLEVGALYEYRFNYYLGLSGASQSYYFLKLGDSINDSTKGRLHEVCVHTAAGAAHRDNGCFVGFFVADSTQHMKIYMVNSGLGSNFSTFQGANPNGTTISGVMANITYTNSTNLSVRKIRSANIVKTLT